MIVLTARGQGTRLPAQPAEMVDIDCLGIDIEHVASRAPGQLHAVSHSVPE